MAALGARLPLATLESVADGDTGVCALLLGTGGFLPLSPAHAALAGMSGGFANRVEASYAAHAVSFHIEPLPATTWSLNRVRPTNHPVRRLASLADLVERSRSDGLLATFLALPLDAGRAWREWLGAVRPAIGRSRSDQIAVNVLAPFLAAYADVVGDEQLADRVGQLWETLPGAADDSIAKATLTQIVGDAGFRVSLAVESQGLHEIGRNGCRQLRCFECPIAALAVMHEPETVPGSVQSG
jgi:hypothetical protein